jgi:hypothetical protein
VWPGDSRHPHTVGEIAKDLGRSVGKVGNALTTLADRAEAARITGKPLRYEANSATRRRSRRHHPQGTLTAQARLCRAVGRAEAGHLVSAEGSRPEGRARPGDPPWRAGLPAARVLGGRPG